MSFSNVFKRMGKTRVRVTFFIEVQTLVISPISGLDEGDDLNILFERGDKSVSSAAKTMSANKDDDLTATFGEILKLDCTLYRDSNGVFQEKQGKLTVRQRKSGTAGLKAGRDAFKAIGVAPLLLHTFVNSPDAHKQLTLPLLWCMADTATLTVSISTRISDSAQNSEADSDDNSSITSTPSLPAALAGTRPTGIPTVRGSSSTSSSFTASSAPSAPSTSSTIPSSISSPPNKTSAFKGKVTIIAPPPAGRSKAGSGKSLTGKSLQESEEKDEEEAVTGSSWAARKGGKKVTRPDPSNPNPNPSYPSTHTSNKTEDSEDGFRNSTGSSTVTGGVATKGAQFTVDDWQPDFNGSSSTASVKVSPQRAFEDPFGPGSDVWGEEHLDKSKAEKAEKTKASPKVSPILQKMNEMKGKEKEKEKEGMSSSFQKNGSGGFGIGSGSEEEIYRLQEETKQLKEENTRLKRVSKEREATGGGGGDDEVDALRSKVKSLTADLKEARQLLEEISSEKDEKSSENSKLLRDLQELRMSAVPLAEATDTWKHTCSELKINLQAYAARLTTMEVQLAEAQIAHLIGGRRLSGGFEPPVKLSPPPVPPQQAQGGGQGQARPSPLQQFQLSTQQTQQQQSHGQPIQQIIQQQQSSSRIPVAVSSVAKEKERTQEKIQERMQDRQDRDREVVKEVKASKFSNFVNSTKKPVESPGSSSPQYQGKRTPAAHYSKGGIDLS